MSVNIEVDRDAYTRLEQARHGAESLSDVIKRYVPPHRELDEILRVMRKASISERTLDAIDESASRRRRACRAGRDAARGRAHDGVQRRTIYPLV